jgi:hypothetical protein
MLPTGAGWLLRSELIGPADPAYDRLAQVKWMYDPTNLFRRNQNIEPRPAVPA